MSQKPPKPSLPAGIEPSPRKKEKRKDTRDSILAALTELISAEPTVQHYTQYFEEANAEKNDRGAAILIATNLENGLESAIIRQLQLGGKRRDLFGLNSPVGTFDFKIRIGHALRIFGDETRGNLDVIRSIRNTFAHAKIPIQITEPAVTKACALLVIPRLLPPVSHPIGWQPETQEELAAIQGKKRFERVCNETAHNLIMRSLGGPHEIATEALREIGMVADAYTVLAIQKPLP